VTLDTVKRHVTHVLGKPGPTAPANTRSPATPPEEIMSKLLRLLERNRVLAATGAHAGLAMKQLFGQRIRQSSEGRRVRLRPEVLS
jgi:hypothetical protein